MDLLDRFLALIRKPVRYKNLRKSAKPWYVAKPPRSQNYAEMMFRRTFYPDRCPTSTNMHRYVCDVEGCSEQRTVWDPETKSYLCKYVHEDVEP